MKIALVIFEKQLHKRIDFSSDKQIIINPRRVTLYAHFNEKLRDKLAVPFGMCVAINVKVNFKIMGKWQNVEMSIRK